MVKIGVIIGSVRDVRVGNSIAKWAVGQMPKSTDVEYEIIDLKEWNLPLLNEPNLPAMGDYKNEITKKWSAKISEFDGYIFVTAEYNHGYTAALKNAIDTIYAEWAKKPVAFVGYGALGGARAIEQLVQVTAQLNMVPLPSVAINVIDVWAALDDSGNVKPENVRGNAEKLSESLLWWAQTLKTSR